MAEEKVDEEQPKKSILFPEDVSLAPKEKVDRAQAVKNIVAGVREWAFGILETKEEPKPYTPGAERAASRGRGRGRGRSAVPREDFPDPLSEFKSRQQSGRDRARDRMRKYNTKKLGQGYITKEDKELSIFDRVEAIRASLKEDRTHKNKPSSSLTNARFIESLMKLEKHPGDKPANLNEEGSFRMSVDGSVNLYHNGTYQHVTTLTVTAEFTYEQLDRYCSDLESAIHHLITNPSKGANHRPIIRKLTDLKVDLENLITRPQGPKPRRVR